MTANTNIEHGKIRVYAAGGCGIGIGKYFENDRGKENKGYASLHPCYIDTSIASTFGVPEEYFYHLEEKDGSGGVRAFNGPDIMRRSKEIIQQFPPMDLNVVIGSTSGGSGSVISPALVTELLEMDKPVIVFCIGGDDTLQYIDNTMKTMLSYEGISKVRQKPVVLQYLQNGVDGTVEEVDFKVHLAISCLTVLYSRQNKNLDTRDLYNWLNFNNVTSYGPQIGVLTINNKKDFKDSSNIISLATLNVDLNNTKIDQPVEYQRVGVPMLGEQDQSNFDYPLHFAISDGYVDKVMKNLRGQYDAYQSKAKARVVMNQLSKGDENVTDSGLVF